MQTNDKIKKEILKYFFILHLVVFLLMTYDNQTGQYCQEKRNYSYSGIEYSSFFFSTLTA